MSPKVSILIPTYNQSRFLGRAIESALNQDYSNIEVIVSDDASTENLQEVIKPFSKRNNFRYFRHSQNVGRVANYAYLAENLANGEWALNLDGDDFFTDNTFISTAIEMVLTMPKVVFFQAGQINRYGSSFLTKLPPITGEVELVEGKDYFMKFYKNYYFSHLTTLYNLKEARKINFQFYKEDIISSDVATFLKLALHGNIIFYKKTMGEWTGHSTNFTKIASVTSRKHNINILIKACYDYASSLKLFPESDLKNWKNKMKEELYYLHLIQFLCTKNVRIFMSVFTEIFTLPLNRIMSKRFLTKFWGVLFDCLKSKF